MKFMIVCTAKVTKQDVGENDSMCSQKNPRSIIGEQSCTGHEEDFPVSFTIIV